MSPDEHKREDLIPDPQPGKRQGIMQRSKDMLDSAVSGLKGRDMLTLVDEFTSEMTLVAEGLSEDLQHAREQLSQLGADQTIASEGSLRMAGEIQQLQKRVEALEKKQDRLTVKRGTLTGVLRQITVIAAIIAAAWVITALLGVFGGR